MNPFTTDPTGCPVTYTCEFQNSPMPTVDLCNFEMPGSSTTFDPTTGNFQLMVTDQ